MSKLIIKSPYMKSGKTAGGYMKYIATRDGVETLPQPEVYMNYIANRPGVEHGLFSDDGCVDLQNAMDELQKHEGNVWTHIISLRREDAARLGYDNAYSWQNLLKSHRNDIAEAMKISPNSLRWYAAFHNEGEHPHVHMMAWSADPGQGYLSKIGISQMKSVLTNDIFRQEMLYIYEQKSISRDELVREARRTMAELTAQMGADNSAHLEIEKHMLALADRLKTVSGKKQYGYLPKGVKKLVDEIVRELEQIPAVAECYEKWWELSEQVRTYYSGIPQEKPPLSQQKEFRSIKNAIIQEAETLSLGSVHTENVEHKVPPLPSAVPIQAPPQIKSSNVPFITNSVANLLHHLSKTFNNSFYATDSKSGLHIDSKRRRKLMEKKIAQGHSPKDHMEQRM